MLCRWLFALLSHFFWLLCCLAFKLRLLITPLASWNFSYPFSFGYCVVWPSNYGFWLPLWRLQAFLVLFRSVIVLSSLQMTASDYPFGVFKLFLSFFFWLLCCLAFKLRLLITPLASSNFSCPYVGYCVVWPSNYGFWLPLWHLQTFLVLFLLVIVLSGLPITASDYPFGIFKLFLSFFFWLLCFLAFKLRLLITPLASSSFFVLFLSVIVLSSLQITASDYPFGVFKLFLSFFFWLLCCLDFQLRFWLPLWHLQTFLILFLLVIVLSGLQITASDYPFGVFKLFLSFFFWLLCCLAFKYGFWLSLWHLQAFLVLFLLVIVLSGLQITASDYPFGVFKLFLSFFLWLLCCLAFQLRLCLPVWRLQAFLVLFPLVIVLSGLQITASDYLFGVFKLFLSFFFWLLCCLAFKLRLLIAPFGIFKLFLSFFFWLLCCQAFKLRLLIALFGIFKLLLSFFFSWLCCLAFKLRLLITPLASSSFSCPFSFGYCVMWTSNYGFWLPLWRLQAFLVLFHLVIVLSGLHITASDYPFWHLQTFLVLFHLVIVLSGLQITASDYPFGIFKLFLSFFFWLLCCLAFKLRLLITPLASSSFSCPFSFGYCGVWTSHYGFWLPIWRLQTFLVLFLLVIVLSGLQMTLLIAPFGIFKLFLSFFFWLLCCLAFKLRLLIIFLASSSFSCPFSFGYCVVWPSNYAYVYSFGVFKLFLSFFLWLLCCLAFKLRLLITPLASSSFSCPFSFGYCVVWPSNYGFWLSLWRLQAFLVLFLLVIVLSGLQITASDYPFGVFKLFLSFFLWLLCCLAFQLRLCLPVWRLQAFLVLFPLVIVLSGLQITASDYLFGVFKLFLSFFFWLLCCLAFKLRLLIAPFGIFKLFLFFFFWLLCCLAFKLRLLIALFGIFKLLLSFFFSWLCCLAFKLRLLITPLASSSFSCPFSFDYCVVWPSNCGFWLPLWRLQAFLVLFPLVIVLSGLPMTASDYPFGIFKLFLSFFFWLLCCQAFKLRLLITPLASSSFSCPFSFGYCVVWPSNYGFWLPLWHLQTFLVLFPLVIVLSGLQITASDYPFGIFKLFLSFFFWLLCCLAFKLRLLIIPLASSSFSCPFSFGYCVVWPSNNGFWLSLWRLQAFLVLFPLVIVLSGLPITLMFTRLASSSFSCPFSFGYCVVWPSNYGFWLPLWRLQAFLVLFLLVIALSGLQITASDSPFWHLQTFLVLFLLVIVLSGL